MLHDSNAQQQSIFIYRPVSSLNHERSRKFVTDYEFYLLFVKPSCDPLRGPVMKDTCYVLLEI